MTHLPVHMPRVLLTAMLSIPAFASVSEAAPAEGNAVLEWNAVATAAFVPTQGSDPVNQSRTYAMLHAAVHDALNAIEPEYEFYTPGLPWLPAASPDAAVAAASHGVLMALIPGEQAFIHAAYLAALAMIPDGPEKEQGIYLGVTAAELILARRADDGAAQAFSAAYVPTGAPGDYTFTPPFDAPPLGPFVFGTGWGDVTPFAIELKAFHLPGPLPLRSAAYARDFAYVKAIGAVDSTLRTAEQSEIARFWYEDSPIGWNRIANTVLTQEHVALRESARILALMNFAMADGFIAGFATKFEARFWRPVTAIREAAYDGNAQTTADENWSSYLTTPPVPDYPSTHTVLGAAAARVLIHFLGDRIHFSTTSVTEPGVTRSFVSFSEAALENGISRVYAGIHFERAVEHGHLQGTRIGQKTVHLLKPLH